MYKLKPGTKVKIIANHTLHGITIGTICHVDYLKEGISGYIYIVTDLDFEWHVSSKDIEVVEDTTFKVGDIVTIGDNITVYKIEKLFDGHMAKLVHLKTRNRYDYNLNRLKLYTGTDTVDDTEYKVGDTVKVINVGKMISTLNIAAKAMGLTQWVRSNYLYTSEQIESITNNNYYKVIGSYVHCLSNCIGIENLFNGDQYMILEEGLKHINLYSSTSTGTNTGCIDYPISYIDTSTCTVNKQGTITNTLLTNNNTMEKLNQLRADKFFALEKNLTAIESLDTLLKDAIELVVATKGELDRVQTKLIGLNRKLESATNNQDVALLKDLIASTKVVESFIKELEDKTISKFETAKTSFDVTGYLKD